MAFDKLKLEVVLSAIDKLSRPLSAAKGKSGELARQLQHTQASITNLQRATRVLEDRMAGAGVPTREMIESQKALAHQADALNERYRVQRAQLTALNEQMRRQQAIAAASERIGRTRDSLAKSGVGLGAAGAATLAGVGSTVSAYAEAEDAATGLRVAMMRANHSVPETFQQLNELATQLGDKLPGTTADFQTMMTTLIRQGMSAESILGGLGKATAYLAVQMKMPTDQAAEFAAKMQDATRSTEGEMMDLMDVIQRSFYAGVDPANMLNAFAKLSPALGVLKAQGLEGARALAPLIALMDQAGMAGEASGNAIRKVLQMSLDAKKVAKGNAAGGVKLDFTNGRGEFGGLDQLFAQLSTLQGLNTQRRLAVIKELYGEDAETLQVVSLLIDKGKTGYAEMQQKMAAQAALQARVNEQLGTLKNEWEAASGSFTNLLATAGAALAPDLKALIQWMGDATASVRAFAAEHPRLMTWLMRIAAGLGVLLGVLGALLIGAAALLAPFAMMGTAMAGVTTAGTLATGAFTLMGGAVSAVTAFLLANPIVAIIAGIAVAATLIYKYWEPIKGFFKGIWTEITNAFSEGIGGIAKLLLNWSPLGAVYDKVRLVAGLFGKKLPPTAADALGAVAEAGRQAGSQASQITSARTGFAPRAAAAPVVQSGPATFQIYAAPGMNPAEVANLVDQKLQQRDTAVRARLRSRFADNH